MFSTRKKIEKLKFNKELILPNNPTPKSLINSKIIAVLLIKITLNNQTNPSNTINSQSFNKIRSSF